MPRESRDLTITVWNAGDQPVDLAGVGIATSFGPVPSPSGLPRSVAPGELASFKLPLAVPAGAEPTFPSYLARPLDGDVYDWSAVPPADRGEPFGPAAVRVRFDLRTGDAHASLERDAVARFADPARGEIRRPLRVVPRLEVSVAPDLVLVPLDASSRPTTSPLLSVSVESNASQPLSGTVELDLACAGPPRPIGHFELTPASASTSFQRPLPACASAGTETARVVARTSDGEEFARALPLIDHPPLPPTPVPQAATVEVVRTRLALPELRGIVYVPGAADRVPGYLAALGLPLTTLDGTALEAAELSRFDVIVIGSRAYQSDPGLARVNARLLDWVRAGGTMIVQYQQYPFVEGHFAPLPLEIARPHDRITDETAPVKVLEPTSAVVNVPNRIGPQDWQGWVQERSLYMPHTWDPGYTPILEMQDPDQPPQRGALLVAKLGKGTYVYTGIAFFREIPAGVPGAYRLFANLLALGGGTR